jgi:hypothetical protein
MNSESINFSEYERISEQSSSGSTDLDILENNNKREDNNSTELSQIYVPVKEQNDIEKQKNIDNSNNIKEISQYTEGAKTSSIHNLLYGNPIDCINPKFLGKSFAFLYDFRGDPKITIGPDCKLIFLYYFLFYT